MNSILNTCQTIEERNEDEMNIVEHPNPSLPLIAVLHPFVDGLFDNILFHSRPGAHQSVISPKLQRLRDASEPYSWAHLAKGTNKQPGMVDVGRMPGTNWSVCESLPSFDQCCILSRLHLIRLHFIQVWQGLACGLTC